MENLLARFRQSGFIILLGIVSIIYIALGAVYFQQGPKQIDLVEQINGLRLVLAKPLPTAEKLEAEYDEVNHALSSLAVPVVLEKLVDIARESGIDVAADKFSIPRPALLEKIKVGKGSYQVLRFRGISVQGEYASVMAFISDLDSGKTLKTMVLTSLDLSQIEVGYEVEEQARRTEFQNVSAAVIKMMTDNNLTAIPKPMNHIGGTAVNYMGDDSGTPDTMEGFPDVVSEWTGSSGGKTRDPDGADYTVGDKPGYVLYEHDRKADAATAPTVSYSSIFKTKYYYTCETDGTVRQFDGPDVKTATEYLYGEETLSEAVAILNVDFYAKLLEGEKP